MPFTTGTEARVAAGAGWQQLSTIEEPALSFDTAAILFGTGATAEETAGSSPEYLYEFPVWFDIILTDNLDGEPYTTVRLPMHFMIYIGRFEAP